MPIDTTLAAPTDVGALGVQQLKRFWSRALAARSGRSASDFAERHSIASSPTRSASGSSRRSTRRPRRRSRDYGAVIVATTGGVDPESVARINAAVSGTAGHPEATRRRLRGYRRHGAGAVGGRHSPTGTSTATSDRARRGAGGHARVAAERAIWAHLGASRRADSCTRPTITASAWCSCSRTRRSRRTADRRGFTKRRALWGTADLWVSTDRAGFNAPERPAGCFAAASHWDVSLTQLHSVRHADDSCISPRRREQGAFTCVPGFHRRIDAWLDHLRRPAPIRASRICTRSGSTPIAGRAGDLIIWDDRLPPGSRPNRGTRPRIVQYVNMYPTRVEHQDVWR